MNIKIISTILLITVLCAAIVSCGSTDGNDVGSSDAQQTEAKTQEETAAETDYLAQYTDTDFGGAVYTFCVLSSESYPNYTGEQENGEPVNDIQYRRDAFVESTYNISIEYITYTGDGEITNLVKAQVLAGENTVDCIEEGMSNGLSNLSSNGLVRDLFTVEGLELDKPWWSQSMNRDFTINNKLFAATGPMTFSYYYSPRIIAFNLRLADVYNVGNLYETVKDGKWTLDYMQGTMKSIKADLDGDGEYGEDDMWGASVDEYSAAGFFISAGGKQTKINADGTPSFLFNEERNYTIIEKVASIIGNEEYTQKAEALASRSGKYDIRDKVYTFKNGHALYLGYGAQAISLYLRDMEDDYGIIPVPKYDEEQENYITFGNAFVPAYIGLPLNNTRDDINGIILNMIGYISQRDLQPLVTSVTLKGKAARDEESQDMIDIIYEDVYLDLNSCYNFGESFILVRDITMGKKSNFISSWEKISSKSEKAIVKLFDDFAAMDLAE